MLEKHDFLFFKLVLNWLEFSHPGSNSEKILAANLSWLNISSMTSQARLRLVSLGVSFFSLGMVALFPFINFTFLFHLCREVFVWLRKGMHQRVPAFSGIANSGNYDSVTLRWKCLQLECIVKGKKLTLLTGVQSYDFIWILQWLFHTRFKTQADEWFHNLQQLCEVVLLKIVTCCSSVSSEDRMRIERLKLQFLQERHNLDIRDFLFTMVVMKGTDF